MERPPKCYLWRLSGEDALPGLAVMSDTTHPLAVQVQRGPGTLGCMVTPTPHSLLKS